MTKRPDLIEPARNSSFWAALATQLSICLALAIAPPDQDLSWRLQSFLFVFVFSVFVSPFTYVCFFAGTAVTALAAYDVLTRLKVLNRITAVVLGAGFSAAASLILIRFGFLPGDWTFIGPIAAGGAVGGWTYLRGLREQQIKPPPAPPSAALTP